MVKKMIDSSDTIMPVCKLDFDDEEEEQEYQNFTKSFRENMAMEVNNSMEGNKFGQKCSNFSNYRRQKQPGRVIFSPRKPIRNYFNKFSDEVSPISTNCNVPKASLIKCFNISPSNSVSPPDKKVRALRLFDSPNTPKTLLQKSAQDATPLRRTLDHNNQPLSSRPATRSCLFGGTTTNNGHNRQRTHYNGGATTNTDISDSTMMLGEDNGEGITITSDLSDTAYAALVTTFEIGSKRPKSGPTDEAKNMRANVNPFTPTNILMSSKKRSRKIKKLNRSK